MGAVIQWSGSEKIASEDLEVGQLGSGSSDHANSDQEISNQESLNLGANGKNTGSKIVVLFLL